MAHVDGPAIAEQAFCSAIPVIPDLFDALVCHIDFRLQINALGIGITVISIDGQHGYHICSVANGNDSGRHDIGAECHVIIRPCIVDAQGGRDGSFGHTGHINRDDDRLSCSQGSGQVSSVKTEFRRIGADDADIGG